MSKIRRFNSKTRLGWVGLVLMAGVVLFAVWHTAHTNAGQADQGTGLDMAEAIRMMPPDTWLIAHADAKKVLAQPALAILADNILSFAEAEERELEKVVADFAFETGVHPKDDVERVVVAAGLLSRRGPSIAFMAQANWDTEGAPEFFSKQMPRQPLTKQQVNGETLFSWARPNREPEVGLTFPRQCVMLVGSFPMVKTMVAQTHGRDANLLDGRMRKALNAVDRTAIIWSIWALPAPAIQEVYEESWERRKRERFEQIFCRCLIPAASFSASLKLQPDGVLVTLTCHTLVEEDTARYARQIQALRQKSLEEIQKELDRAAKRRSRDRDLEMKTLRLLTGAINAAEIVPGKGRVDIRLRRSNAQVSEISALFAEATGLSERRRRGRP